MYGNIDRASIYVLYGINTLDVGHLCTFNSIIYL